MQKKLYPLKFQTIYKDKIWGGHKIKNILKKDIGNLPNCGETWELSGVKGDVSIVANGSLKGQPLTEVIEKFKDDVLGQGGYEKYGNEFPLLIKFIDANQDLSIQVHPNDELAKKRHNCLGKTEMWYVLQADDNAKLIAGFNQPLNKEKYLEYFNSGKLMEILNQETIKTDDVFFIPSGRVHTIGKGLMIAEIQQTSDITYRIYDFDRVDDKGNKRELHVEQAIDAIDYKHYPEYKTLYKDKLNERITIVTCQYFTTNKLWLNKPYKVVKKTNQDFRIYTCLEGKASFESSFGNIEVKKGEVILMPAIIHEFNIIPHKEVKLLESFT